MSATNSTASEGRTVLGIDIGTTSVKVCVVRNRKILGTCSKETQASLTNPSEQDVMLIIKAVENCIKPFSKDLLGSVDHIGITGQMHGVCLWKYQTPLPASDCIGSTDAHLYKNFQYFKAYKEKSISPLYTWMDQRCDSKFLASLPIPDSNLRLSTGHGCATLFWLTRNSPDALENYDSAGTIMDFFVTNLCGLTRPVMSEQNAASWGYFNCEQRKWNTEILKSARFPTDLLPDICERNIKVAGKLFSDWLDLKAGTTVGPALGDLQCSVYSSFLDNSSAYISMSTSAQIGYLTPSLPKTPNPKIEHFPYFGNTYFAVGASLNGGNVLQAYVTSILNLCKELDIAMNHVDNDFIWDKILTSAALVPSTDLIITPTLFGERHAPEEKASVCNVSPQNISTGHFTRGLIKGLVTNFNQFIGVEELKMLNITTVYACGSSILRNPVMQEELRRNYSEFDIRFLDSKFSDAAYGAALYFSE